MTDDGVSAEARALDRGDALAPLRSRFRLPLAPDGRVAVYLCGNSLGPMPVDAEARVREVLERLGDARGPGPPRRARSAGPTTTRSSPRRSPAWSAPRPLRSWR